MLNWAAIPRNLPWGQHDRPVTMADEDVPTATLKLARVNLHDEGRVALAQDALSGAERSKLAALDVELYEIRHKSTVVGPLVKAKLVATIADHSLNGLDQAGNAWVQPKTLAHHPKTRG